MTVVSVGAPSQHCRCADWDFYVQEVHGEKNGQPIVLRHTAMPILPKCGKNSQGQTEVPEEIHTWKGSIFSVFSNKVANWESSGYGALLQTPSVPFPHLLSDMLAACHMTMLPDAGLLQWQETFSSYCVQHSSCEPPLVSQAICQA